MIFAHTCLSCGCTSEPRLIEVGAVLIIRCDKCDGFIRYTHMNDYPTILDIKAAIWDISLKNILIINEVMAHITPTRRNLWRAYLAISKKLSKKTFS